MAHLTRTTLDEIAFTIQLGLELPPDYDGPRLPQLLGELTEERFRQPGEPTPSEKRADEDTAVAVEAALR